MSPFGPPEPSSPGPAADGPAAAGRRRWLRWSLLVLGGLVVLSAAWLAVTGLLAMRAAHSVQADLRTIDAAVADGRLDTVSSVSADLASHASQARTMTSGPVWWSVARLPWLGRPARVVRGSTRVADELARTVVPDVVGLTRDLDPHALRPSGDSINLAALQRAQPRLDRVAQRLATATGEVTALPSHTWLSSIDRERAKLVTRLTAVDGYLDAARRVATVLPEMGGQYGTKRYFVGLQNEAEMRGTGGLPGSFAILEATNGTARFTQFLSDSALIPAGNGPLPTGLDFGPAYDAAWLKSEPYTQYIDSNVSPNFPYAAQIWAAMWKKVSGQEVDGAIALDPTALSYFLAVTGPAAADGTQVTAANVVALTQQEAYTKFPDTQARKEFLVSLTKAVDSKLISGAGDVHSLIKAGARAGTERRFQVWFRDPAIERELEGSDFAGAIPVSAQPFSAVVVNNAAGGKLDYYLHRTVSYRRTGCGATRDVTVTVSLANGAPAGLPQYVSGRLDSHAKSAQSGDNRVLFDYIATEGATLISVTLNGQPSGLGTLTEEGHPMYRLDLELPRGQTQTLVLHLREPAGTQPPKLWQQPGVSPVAVSVSDEKCG